MINYIFHQNLKHVLFGRIFYEKASHRLEENISNTYIQQNVYIQKI